MAKTTKLTVATNVGTFTRQTARAYTHIVVVGGHTEAYARRQVAFQRVGIKSGIDHRVAQLAGKQPAFGRTREQLEADIAADRAELAAFDEAERMRAYTDQPFGVLGWCGRLDLAHALATSKHALTYASVRIFEVATGQAVRW